ncbi:MAG: M1 family aminopeptidase [Candidatus Cyclobacteriaceae bacterium M2_1C_046]
MKFPEVFRFEFAYQIRRPWTWLFFAVLTILSFLMTRDGSLSEVLYAEFFLNSPFSIAKTTVFGSLIWLVIAAAIAGEAAARDVVTGMHPLIYTTSINKLSYLGGRFLAAFSLNALILLAVQLGIVMGVYLPGVDAELIGPFRPSAFLTAYGIISLPNAFAATAIQFFFTSRSGRVMSGYFGSFLLVFMGFFIAAILLYHRSIGTLIDPIGMRFIVEDVAHLWTTVEKNWRLLKLEGIVLNNRLVWVSVAFLTLCFTYLSFHFAHRTETSRWSRMKQFLGRILPGRRDDYPSGSYIPTPAGMSVSRRRTISTPQVSRTFGFVTHLHQIFTISSKSFWAIAKSWAGITLLIGIPLLTIPVLIDQTGSVIPATIQIISELTASMTDELSRWVIIPFLIIFFAGELIWYERDARLDEITDTIPGSEWAPLLGKFLGLVLVLTLFITLQTTAGIITQAIKGYQEFEIELYLKIMFGLQLPEYLLLALLAFVVHIYMNHKYFGHLVAILAYVFIILASLFGIEHNMLIYGASPGWSYTEMRGFGTSLLPWLWFKFYWAAWAVLLAVLARLLWVRGKESSLNIRIAVARQRFTHTTAWTAVIAVMLMLSVGGFIFYNTNILNEYLTTSDIKERKAEYELQYGHYNNIAQPEILATKLHVEIYPEKRTADIRGTYTLINDSSTEIDSIHITSPTGVDFTTVAFNKPAAKVLHDNQLYYQIYKLEKPLQPDDSLQLNFQVYAEPNGFRESGIDNSIVENGTYFTNEWLPTIGYQPGRELINASDRREYKLTAQPIIPSLYDLDARQDRGRAMTFEAVMGTHIDQVAVAPGKFLGTWTEGERRYFHYSTDRAGGDLSFFSANYAVHEERWQNPDSADQVVEIRIFHHPGHTSNLEHMVKSIRASMNYYTRQFGAYKNNYLTVVERPGNGRGMHADAGMITYSEGFSLWQSKANQLTPDHPFAVVAHEVAHQWTVPYANVEGAPVMSESVAWYYAMKVVENEYGQEHLQKLLTWMRNSNRREIRRGEPLLRGLDPYMSYRKGPFALHALSEYAGEKQINEALRSLLEKHRHEEAPLATTLDLYRELQTVIPDSLRYLLHDLFEVNTYWKFEIEQGRARQLEDGNWELTLNVDAQKVVLDSAGVEIEVPMDDWVEIGVFAPGPTSEKTGEQIYLQKHRISSGKQAITISLPQKPGSVDIDPYLLLPVLKADDHIENVNIE